MVLNNICLHIVEFRIDYGNELQYYLCGFSNYGSIKRFIDDVRNNDRDCISIHCNDVTTAIMDLKTWLCNGFDTIDYKSIFDNHFNRIYKGA